MIVRPNLRPLLATAALGCAAATLAFAAAPAHALDLTVEVSGARSDKGYVAVAVYADGAAWMKQTLRTERVAAGARAVIVLRDLPAGRYALAVIHDENGNGKLDTNVVGLPTEPYGFSRGARGSFGPAKWDDAVIALEADARIKVDLQ